jgi:ABC-type nitrate/sulfonate/bicarbonate transport system permease component
MNRVKKYSSIIVIPLLLLLWYFSCLHGWVGKSLLASPQEIFSVFKTALHPAAAGEALFRHAQDTMVRAFIGWGLALSGGILAGLLLGLNAVIYRAFEPLLEFIRSIPPIMGFPVFLVAFNYGSPAYIWTIAVGCLPIMVLTVARGVQSLDRTRLDLLKIHGVSSPVKCFAAVMEVLPSIFLGSRLTFSIALIVSVVTEMVFSPRTGFALGALAKDSEISFDTPTFYACIVILGIIGFTINAVMRGAERWLTGESSTAATTATK